MTRTFVTLAAGAAVLGLSPLAAAQQCYDGNHQCFVFGKPSEDLTEGERLETDLQLRSQKLKVTGDIRLRMRASDSPSDEPYNDNDQQATRTRVQVEFQATEKVRAFVEVNYSETWAGSGSYSDAQGGSANNPNFDGIAQAYVHADDMFGWGDNWRFGRSEYVLSNGLVLGSCDFLQRPATFTGGWVSREFGGHDIELFMFDDYGPLQSTHDPVRYFGGTARFETNEGTDGALDSIRPYLLVGSHDGDLPSDDTWYGVDANGKLPGDFDWAAEFARRDRDTASDETAFKLQVAKDLDAFEGKVESASLTYTDASGAMHVNPADFNSAGLLHQYGGAWRSDLATTQLGVNCAPGYEMDLDFNFLHLDRRGNSPQEGEFEADVLVGKQLASGVHAAAGYGLDDESRQVAYFLLTVYF